LLSIKVHDFSSRSIKVYSKPMKKTTSAVVALSLDAVGPLALLALREQWRQGGSPEMAAEFAELSLAAF
jgi:hypothetical protein